MVVLTVYINPVQMDTQSGKEGLRWWVVAHQVDGFCPDHAPHVHVVAHVDGTANAIARCPDQLQKKFERAFVEDPMEHWQQMSAQIYLVSKCKQTVWARSTHSS